MGVKKMVKLMVGGKEVTREEAIKIATASYRAGQQLVKNGVNNAKANDGVIDKVKEKLSSEVLNIENRTDLTEEEKITRIITVFGTTCSAIAIQPIPFADIFILTPIQAFMGKKIADIRGYDISESGTKEIIKELGGLVGLGFLSQQLAIGAYKTVLPFLGAITTIPLVFGLTYGIGRVMDYYFITKTKGEKIDEEMLKSIFKSAQKEGKKTAKENKDEIKKRKNEFKN